MSLMYHDTVIAGTPVIDSTPTAGSNHAVSSGGVKSAINSVEDDIAIRVVGNKTTYASGAAIGQYVIVSGSTITGIADGMYKAAKAIPYNTVIDSTYLTAVSGGGLNDLKAALPQFQIKYMHEILTTNSNGNAQSSLSWEHEILAVNMLNDQYAIPYRSGENPAKWYFRTKTWDDTLIRNATNDYIVLYI